MELVFDLKKTYKLIIDRDGHELIFTATNMKIFGELISFSDRNNKQLVFPLEALRQADEVKE